MDVNMVQEIDSIGQYPFFLVFLKLRKECGILYRGHLLQNLEGYGSGSKICDILADFWKNQEVVTRQIRYHAPQLRATHGTTKRGLESPTLFNVSVDSVVRQ